MKNKMKLTALKFGMDYELGCMWCDIEYNDGSKIEKNYCIDTEKAKNNGDLVKAILSSIDEILNDDKENE